MIRSMVPEEMDRPDVDPIEHVRALRALNRINAMFGLDRRIARRILRLAANPAVLDLGCGGGGLLRSLHGALPAQGRPFRLIGLDRAAFALYNARQWHSIPAAWVAADALRIPLADASVDVATSSLFLHHFSSHDAVSLLREAARVARLGIVIGDLARSAPAWLLTVLGTRLLTRSRLVHVDGPRSVRAAFTAAELADLAAKAGLHGATVQRQFPFRLLLSWVR